MENILHDFNEKVISLMTEFLKNSIEAGGLSNFTDNLMDNLMQLGYDLTKFSLEYAEDIIFKIKESAKFKVGTIPAMEFGTSEQRKFLKQLLEYKKVV